MIAIDTPYHVTFSSAHIKPIYACVSTCKKCFWAFDIEDDENKKICTQCKGLLKKATEGVHFKVLDCAQRNLKIADITRFSSLTDEEEKGLKEALNHGAHVSHLSNVKDKFVEKALKEWC